MKEATYTKSLGTALNQIKQKKKSDKKEWSSKITEKIEETEFSNKKKKKIKIKLILACQ